MRISQSKGQSMGYKSAIIPKTKIFYLYLTHGSFSLYWFAALQQTSTCTRQKYRSIYSKFGVE